MKAPLGAPPPIWMAAECSSIRLSTWSTCSSGSWAMLSASEPTPPPSPTVLAWKIASPLVSSSNGALGAIASTTATNPGFPHRVEVYGSEGGAQIEGEKIVRWETQAGPVDTSAMGGNDPRPPPPVQQLTRRPSVWITTHGWSRTSWMPSRGKPRCSYPAKKAAARWPSSLQHTNPLKVEER